MTLLIFMIELKVCLMYATLKPSVKKTKIQIVDVCHFIENIYKHFFCKYLL